MLSFFITPSLCLLFWWWAKLQCLCQMVGSVSVHFLTLASSQHSEAYLPHSQKLKGGRFTFFNPEKFHFYGSSGKTGEGGEKVVLPNLLLCWRKTCTNCSIPLSTAIHSIDFLPPVLPPSLKSFFISCQCSHSVKMTMMALGGKPKCMGSFDVTWLLARRQKMVRGHSISETLPPDCPSLPESVPDSYLCCYSQPAGFIDLGQQQWDKILVQQRQ